MLDVTRGAKVDFFSIYRMQNWTSISNANLIFKKIEEGIVLLNEFQT